MKKILLVLLAVNVCCSRPALAAVYVMNGKQISKLDAVMALAKDRGAEVYKMDQVELTDKATLKNKKVSK